MSSLAQQQSSNVLAGDMHKMPQIASLSFLFYHPQQNADVPACILATYAFRDKLMKCSQPFSTAYEVIHVGAATHDSDSHTSGTEAHTASPASQTTTVLALPIGKTVQKDL